MAASLSVEVTQSDVAVVTTGTNLQSSQSDVSVVFNIPSEEVEASQADFSFVSLSTSDVQVSQADVLVVMRGRIDDPAVRAWTFTLDGHDFYVLRLGNNETLVYDLTTEQWSTWASGNELFWSVYTGANWFGGNTFAASFGSNIIVGSDANGSLFFLDPNKPDDDAVVEGREPSLFRRRLTGQIATRGYNLTKVFEVQLLGSIGQLDLGANTDISLLYSDDRGDSYVSAGVINTVEDDYDIRGSWRSLGSFSSPGRLFRVEDFGALKRIDSLTVSTDQPQG